MSGKRRLVPAVLHLFAAKLVCCLSCLLNIQFGLIFVIKGAEVGGGGCFDDREKAGLQEVLW